MHKYLFKKINRINYNYLFRYKLIIWNTINIYHFLYIYFFFTFYYIYSDGSYFIGEFKDGNRYNGKEYKKDGKLYSTWKDEKYTYA